MSQKIISEYRAAFREAEKAIRFADYSISSLATSEQERGDCCALPIVAPKGVSIAAVNELRYSAHHFSKALSLKIDPSFDDQKKRSIKREREDQRQHALRHCYRARFDALQATILHFARDFKAFAEDYKTVYSETDGVDEHGRLIAENIEFLCNGSSGDTEEICSRLQNAIEILKPKYLLSLSQRSRFNTILAEIQTQKSIIGEQSQKLEQHDKNSTRQFLIGLFVGLAIGLAGFLFQFFSGTKQNDEKLPIENPVAVCQTVLKKHIILIKPREPASYMCAVSRRSPSPIPSIGRLYQSCSSPRLI